MKDGAGGDFKTPARLQEGSPDAWCGTLGQAQAARETGKKEFQKEAVLSSHQLFISGSSGLDSVLCGSVSSVSNSLVSRSGGNLRPELRWGSAVQRLNETECGQWYHVIGRSVRGISLFHIPIWCCCSGKRRAGTDGRADSGEIWSSGQVPNARRILHN